MKTLVPCVGCGRHVRASESACPFCGAAVTEEMAARATPAPSARLGRAALFAFGATIAVSATACGGGTPGNDAATPQDVMSQPDGQMMALYGAPPPDAGPADDGSPGARYGAVPAPDAG